MKGSGQLTLPQTHARQGARVRREEKHPFGTGTAGGHHHAFAESEFHLPRREIGHHDDQATHERGGVVEALDAREHGAGDIPAEADGEFEQLPRLGHLLGHEDAGHP